MAEDLKDVLAQTWPADQVLQAGPFRLGVSPGAVKRVTSARAVGAVGRADLDGLATACRSVEQPQRIMVWHDQMDLDALLAAEGYVKHDPVRALAIQAGGLAVPDRMTAFATAHSMAIQQQIWAECGIGPNSLAIMDRVHVPRAYILGRVNDRPSGAGFVAVSGQTAMLHGLEVRATARRRELVQL